jgi:hypothetical protein
MNRRTYLVALGSATAALIAGCADDEPTVEEDTPSTNETAPNSTAEDSSDQPDTETTEDGIQTFDFGDTAQFSTEDEQLSVRPHDARLTDLLISNSGSFLQSQRPDNDLFLLMTVSMTNDGNQPTSVPHELQLVADSTQYDRRTFLFAFEQNYTNYNELRPGVTAEAVAAFDINGTDSEASLFADWGNFVDPVTAEWLLDLGAVGRETTDLRNLPVGRAARIGTETARYRIAVDDYVFSQTYSYEGYGGQQTERAPRGKQWLLARVRAENIGERSVSVPTRFDMAARADGQQYTPVFSQLDNLYSGGEIDAGVTTPGTVLFQVPERVSDVTLRINLTTDLAATWDIRA